MLFAANIMLCRDDLLTFHGPDHLYTILSNCYNDSCHQHCDPVIAAISVIVALVYRVTNPCDMGIFARPGGAKTPACLPLLQGYLLIVYIFDQTL